MVVHVPVAIVVMSLEILVLITGFWQLRTRKANTYHRKLTTPLFYIWWFAFLSGEIFYIIMYML